jgi:hypothetical protein
MDMCRLWVWRGLVGGRTRGLLLYRRSSANTLRYPHLDLPGLLSVYPVLGSAFTNDFAVSEFGYVSVVVWRGRPGVRTRVLLLYW